MADSLLEVYGSIPFDRAAPIYDHTRGFPPGVDEEIAAGLCHLAGLQTGERLLELGVGTGRLALPLAERGLTVFGVDLSRPMLEVLRGKDAAGQVRAVHGDIVALPLASGAFSAVLVVNVLHLVGEWRAALAEAARTLRPGGTFLLGWGRWDEASPASEVRRRWREIVVTLGGKVGRPGENAPQRIIAVLEAQGLRQVDESELVVWRTWTSAAETMRTIVERIYSDSWGVPEHIHRVSLQRLEEWVRRRYADPTEQVEVEHGFRVAVLR